MSKEETLAAIAALPVSDQGKAHATRLVEGLPEWCPMPEYATSDNHDMALLRFVRYHRNEKDTLWIRVGVTHGAPVLGYDSYVFCNMEAHGDNITDRDVHELLRQLTGMVALTRGG